MLEKIPDATLAIMCVDQLDHLTYTCCLSLLHVDCVSSQVERAWSNHKLQTGLTARSAEYEVQYRNFVSKHAPEVWGSYRHFEATRFVFNALTRLNVLSDVKAIAQQHCNFLDSELAHDAVIYVMKELLSGFNLFNNAMSQQEQQCIVIELISASVFWQQ